MARDRTDRHQRRARAGGSHPLTDASRSRITCLVALVVAVGYGVLLESLQRSLDGYYPEHEAWRQALLTERLQGYSSLLWVLCGLSACWAVVVQQRSRLNALHAYVSARLGRAIPIAIAAAAVTVSGLNYWFSTRDWVRFGRPCWDNYCQYAELIYMWLSGQGVEGRLQAFMNEDYHSNSPMGPLLIAGLNLLTGLETTTCYRTAVFLASAGSVLLLWRGLFTLVRTEREAMAAALLLFSTHLIVVRSSFFPQTDAFVLFWSTALLVVAAQRSVAPRAWHGPLSFLILVTGLFVKLSFLPALALLPTWRVAAAVSARRWPDARSLVRDVLLYSLLPFALYLLVQQRLGLMHLYGVELRMITGSDSNLAFVAMSVVHAAAILGPLAWLGRRKWSGVEALLLAWILLYLASLWLSRASGWDRFYLGILPPLTLMAAHGLAVVKERLGPGPLWAGTLLVVVLNYMALWLNVYY